jgi:hypothetical protein
MARDRKELGGPFAGTYRTAFSLLNIPQQNKWRCNQNRHGLIRPQQLQGQRR